MTTQAPKVPGTGGKLGNGAEAYKEVFQIILFREIMRVLFRVTRRYTWLKSALTQREEGNGADCVIIIEAMNGLSVSAYLISARRNLPNIS